MAENDADFLKRMDTRMSRARADRDRQQTRMDDCFRFAMPWRHLTNDEESQTDRLDDIFDSTAMMAVTDFSGDLLATFTPTYANWVDVKPVKQLNDVDFKQISEALEKYTQIVFDEMARSNLYDALQESYPDLAVGTLALTINDYDISEPIHCQAIPITNLLIARGARGGVDDKFREWKVRVEAITELWPNAKLPERFTGSNDKTQEVPIRDGLVRDWNDRSNEHWIYFVASGSDLLFREDYIGAGSCPMIVARWATDNLSAWGIGPLNRVLADIKTVNKVKELGLVALSKNVDPVTAYDDDGVINVDNGINPGDWVARQSGSKIETIESNARFDAAWVEINDLRQTIRQALFQDGPRQRGDTPPTATQWLDEAMKTSRRMGSPTGKLVNELQLPIFKRFAYLLSKRGRLPEIRLGGNQVQVAPMSPLLRSQQQEKLVRLDRALEIIGTRFGLQASMMIFKIGDVATEVCEVLGVDPKLIRSEQEIAGLIQQAAQAQQGGQ